METLTVPIRDLQPHPRNPRRHPAEQVLILRNSLRIHGQQKPVVVTPDFTILAGHGLVEAAEAEAWETVECKVYDGPYPEAFLVIDNRSTELALDDTALLVSLLEDLHGGEGLEATGYDDGDLAFLLAKLQAGSPDGVTFPEFDENLPDSDAKPKTATCPECGHVFTL